ncbi:hypothetical protein SORBI_3008G164850 [Sorghum bicolor]|uniref:Uncharacterized protein n=1 Tax=Sorghum bicolor TaxID=4558 RepID=A0A1Z5R733_SORBI|nr:hypothetical protein SORBI_3008G164850 [Sorghum bicolor]
MSIYYFKFVLLSLYILYNQILYVYKSTRKYIYANIPVYLLKYVSILYSQKAYTSSICTYPQEQLTETR